MPKLSQSPGRTRSLAGLTTLLVTPSLFQAVSYSVMHADFFRLVRKRARRVVDSQQAIGVGAAKAMMPDFWQRFRKMYKPPLKALREDHGILTT